jgi:hypothetical protein
MFELIRNQAQMVTFVMVSSTGTEVTGLGSGFTLEVAKGSGAFAPSAGVKGEIGSGWYHYTLTSTETNTVGPLSVRVNGAGAIQQNLVYLVQSALAGAIEFTYTLTEPDLVTPIQGAQVWIAIDAGFTNILWSGNSDSFGIARDINNLKPFLDPGTYFIKAMKDGYSFPVDTETVS